MESQGNRTLRAGDGVLLSTVEKRLGSWRVPRCRFGYSRAIGCTRATPLPPPLRGGIESDTPTGSS